MSDSFSYVAAVIWRTRIADGDCAAGLAPGQCVVGAREASTVGIREPDAIVEHRSSPRVEGLLRKVGVLRIGAERDRRGGTGHRQY